MLIVCAYLCNFFSVYTIPTPRTADGKFNVMGYIIAEGEVKTRIIQLGLPRENLVV